MGVLFKNENLSDDIIDILKKFQTYTPFTTGNGEKKFVNQLCVGDQLSVERAVNNVSIQSPMATHLKTAWRASTCS